MKLQQLKGIILIALTFAIGNALGQVDIKLSCTLTITSSYSTGTKEQEIKTAIFDVYQTNNLLSILSTSDDFASLSSQKIGILVDVLNMSDENRWHLTNTVQSKINNKIVTTISQVNIDRNSGQIFYKSDFDEGRLIKQANGTCSKIDKTKRKF